MVRIVAGTTCLWVPVVGTSLAGSAVVTADATSIDWPSPIGRTTGRSSI